MLGSYDETGQQVLDDNIMWTTSAKVAWQVTKSAQLSYFNNLQYKYIGHRNGGGTFADSAARNLNDKYPDVHQGKFTSPIGTKFVVDVSYNRFRADDKFGQRPEVADDAISRFDSVTSTYTVALPTYRDNDDVPRSALRQSEFLLRRARHPHWCSVHEGRREIVGMVHVGHASGVRERRSDPGEYVQRARSCSTSGKAPVAFELWNRDIGGLRAGQVERRSRSSS